VGIISDKVTPIHLCETLELVNKKLVSEYLLYFENCADNATLTFSRKELSKVHALGVWGFPFKI
jgi:hypothetical protein